ncbi:MAG: hypothetical protein C5B50_16115 [Verrucomicrobia bacterium]|nr:MAG: hypothetical protein C5B50_16115 [Verrucomicrobiota bacterium]
MHLFRGKNGLRLKRQQGAIGGIEYRTARPDKPFFKDFWGSKTAFLGDCPAFGHSYLADRADRPDKISS